MSYSEEFIKVLADADPEYTTDAIIDFKSLPPGIPTTNFTSFVYKNVVLETNPYRIQPFELFLLEHPEVNAFAYRKDGLSIIGIHSSLYKTLEARLAKTLPHLSEKSSDLLNPINRHIPIDFLMFQFMTLFTYYHELAHLNQLKAEENGVTALFERYNLKQGKDFDKLSHAMEIDADMLAANLISNHVLQYWGKLPLGDRNTQTLEILITIALTSILLFFHEVGGGWHEMYFLEYDHPHEIIRAAYISEIIVNAITLNIQNDRITPNYKVCFQNALLLSDELTVEIDDEPKEFGKTFLENSKNIREYLENQMDPYCKSIDFLIMNWKKEKGT
jgi:hypothetical protein